jgi:hypothetical protein
MDVKVTYNVPIEVTKSQHDYMMNKLEGIVCGRYDESENKYYVMCWNMRYKKIVVQVLQKMK